jgi:hypothetical protein
VLDAEVVLSPESGVRSPESFGAVKYPEHQPQHATLGGPE